MGLKLLTIYILVVASLFCKNASSQNLVWAKQLGGTDRDWSRSLALDGTGNVYTSGFFYGTCDFDPGSGSYNLTSAGFANAYISKLDPSGNFIWVKQFTGTVVQSEALTLDINGMLYLTGHFGGTVDFDPGPSTYNLTAAGTSNIFVVKLDSAGNFIWAKRFGGTGFDVGTAIAVDGTGHVYTTGWFQDTVDFDPGAGTSTLNGPGTFVSKLDPAGNFTWAKMTANGTDASAYSIVIDAAGNIYSAGYFTDTCDFDPGPGTYNLYSSGDWDIFFSKLDSSGNFLWAKQMSGTDKESSFSLALDANDQIYVSGFFEATVDFDPGAGTYFMTSSGFDDIFLAKLDTSGSLIWAKQVGGTEFDATASIAIGGNGKIYLSGDFSGTADFDPGSATYNLTSAGQYDAFILVLDDSGNLLSVSQMGGIYNDIARSVTVDMNGSIYSAGYFQDVVDFDPGNGNQDLISYGDYDIFIMKLDNTMPIGWVEPDGFPEGLKIFPNPANNQFSITGSEKIAAVKIVNLLGEIVYEYKPNTKNFAIELNTEGIYFVTVTSEKNAVTKKMVITGSQ